MNTRLVYCTKTNHSKKIADAISTACSIPAENVTSNPVIKKVDLMILVGGIYGSQSLPEMIHFVQSLDQKSVRKVALMTSCVSKRHTQKEVRNILMNKGIVVVDEFICQGNFLFFGLGHPNKTDMENAVIYAKEVIGVVEAHK
jgi:flavodoxin